MSIQSRDHNNRPVQQLPKVEIIPAEETEHADEILNICVQGDRYSVKRSLLCLVPESKLYDWFLPNSNEGALQDEGGNYFLDLDGKSFRYIVNYLRYKRENKEISTALPSKPDDLATLCTEAKILNIGELCGLCLEMLHYMAGAKSSDVAYVSFIWQRFLQNSQQETVENVNAAK